MTLVKNLGAGALLLGLAAPFAGSPYQAATGQIDISQLAGLIARGEDHIDPLQLAAWIRDRKAGLRVIDVRSPAEFADYAIPTAENIPIDRLPSAHFAGAETVVLYSEGGAHAGQAWVLLKAMGVSNVLFISGGLVDWYVGVMTPTLPADASPAEVLAFEATAELSRYFGGEPQIGGPSPITSPPRATPPPRIADMRRRGC
ncbi:MAG: rhodanese-like domain-containing protein [Sphingomonadales bacterium]|nr:MAG: rhodanese-like domain-containing protein [Sphingomonadales bacterium]